MRNAPRIYYDGGALSQGMDRKGDRTHDLLAANQDQGTRNYGRMTAVLGESGIGAGFQRMKCRTLAGRNGSSNGSAGNHDAELTD
jgi:hypothetical protein